MTLLAVFATLLHRYSGQDKFLRRHGTDGRKRPELEQLLGYFLNPLALRIDCSDDPTFLELLARVRDVVLDALGNDEVPFELVADALEPQRDRRRNPLFPGHLLVGAAATTAARGLEARPLDVDTAIAKFDLVPRAGRSARRADRPLSVSHRSLRERNDPPDGGSLPVAGRRGRRRSAATPVRAADDRWTAERPPDCARGARCGPVPGRRHDPRHASTGWRRRRRTRWRSFSGDEELTYGTLAHRSERLAAALRGLGAGRGAPVGVCLTRSLEFVVAILAVLKAGGAYVPLEPTYPAERLRFMLGDTGATIVLSRAALHQRLALPAAHTVLLDAPASGARPGPAAARPATADDPAYCSCSPRDRPAGRKAWPCRIEPSFDCSSARPTHASGATARF